MKTYREIREVTSETITIPVPQELLHQKVEIILLPADEAAVPDSRQTQKGWPAGFLERFAGGLPEFPEIDSEGAYEPRDTAPKST